MPKVKAYFWNLLIALDQTLNAAAFGYPTKLSPAAFTAKPKPDNGFGRPSAA